MTQKNREDLKIAKNNCKNKLRNLMTMAGRTNDDYIQIFQVIDFYIDSAWEGLYDNNDPLSKSSFIICYLMIKGLFEHLKVKDITHMFLRISRTIKNEVSDLGNLEEYDVKGLIFLAYGENKIDISLS